MIDVRFYLITAHGRQSVPGTTVEKVRRHIADNRAFYGPVKRIVRETRQEFTP